jgi:N-acetylglucosaminyl-diphospho-decaprenol L-rhamnosyltransferase
VSDPSRDPGENPIRAMPHLDIIVVNWNTRELLRNAVRSVAAAPAARFTLDRLVIVDNASIDGSADELGCGLEQLIVLRNTVNRGFGQAANQGAAGSHADYLLFLNPDVELGPNSLTDALEFLQQPANADIGILGIRLADKAGKTQRCCAREPSAGSLVAQSVGLDRLLPKFFPPYFMLDWDHMDTRSIDQVMGAFLIIRRALFDALGGFDRRFFVYFEDADLCLRARKAGWRVVHFAGAHAFHRGQGSTERAKALRLSYFLKSRMLYAYKHFTAVAATAVAITSLFIEPLARIGRACASGAYCDAIAVCKGTAHLWRGLVTARKNDPTSP